MTGTGTWDTGEWLLLLSCLIYFLLALITSRGFIAAPLRRLLDEEVVAVRAEIELLSKRATSGYAGPLTESLLARLRRITSPPDRRWWLRPLTWVADSPLTVVCADTVQLDSVRRDLLDLVSDNCVNGYEAPLLERLATVDSRAAAALRKQLAASADPAAKRRLLKYAHDLTCGPAHERMAAEFESQRVALWLAAVGLIAVAGVGLAAREHQALLLFGAIGGFLAPVLRSALGQKATSWGVMVLSPVGGALTAAGGLLLVRMLSDPSINVLGEVFRNNSWDRPGSVLALALALLFGFSGRLFSRLAIAGTAQLAPPRDAETDQPALAGQGRDDST